MPYIIGVFLFLLAILLGFIALRTVRRLIISATSRIFASLELVSEQVYGLASDFQATDAELTDLKSAVREVQQLIRVNANQSLVLPQFSAHIDVASSEPVLVNLGCGSTFHPRWINLDLNPVSPDVYCVDVGSILPFDDLSIDVAYASHVLEHLPPHQAPCFMREVQRVLKHGGIFRVVIPDLEQITNEYLHSLRKARSGDETDRLCHEWMVIELIDQVARQTNDGGEMLRFLLRHGEMGLNIAAQRLGEEIVSTCLPWDASKTKAEWIREISANESYFDDAIFDRRRAMTVLDTGLFRRSGEPHLWMYDEVLLSALFADTGFVSVERMTAKTSRILEFTTYQLDVTEAGLIRKPDSLYMEAVKPSSTEC